MQEFITIPTYLIGELSEDKLYALMDILSMADKNNEVHISVRQLMNRWKWGNTKTVNFIKFLCEQDVCKTETRQKQDTKKQEYTEIYKRIIDYLNAACGTNYKDTTAGNRADIKKRLKEQYTEQDFYTVIDKKAKEWKGTERERYLRPSTLFGNKFGEYLNQKIVEDKPKNKFCDIKQNDYNFDELEKQILSN